VAQVEDYTVRKYLCDKWYTPSPHPPGAQGQRANQCLRQACEAMQATGEKISAHGLALSRNT